MSGKPSSKPLLRCRLHRWLISQCANDGSLLHNNGHVSHCADCQAFFRTWETIEHTLYHEHRSVDEDAADLIMAQIRSQKVALTEIQPKAKLIRPLAITFAALLLLGVIGALIWNNDEQAAPVADNVEKVEPIPAPVEEKPDGTDSPLEMLLAMQQEQRLVRSDISKFETMLAERVILFRDTE